MNGRKWMQERVVLAANEHAAVIKQFGLLPLSEMPDNERSGFMEAGVWALQNPKPILDAIRTEKPFTVLVGMQPGNNLHLGHLTLMRELAWLMKKGGVPI